MSIPMCIFPSLFGALQSTLPPAWLPKAARRDLCSPLEAQSHLRPSNTGSPCSGGTPWDPAHTCHLQLLPTSRLRESLVRIRDSKGSA